MFERAFKDFDFPQVIRTDSGVAFASPFAFYRLSRPAVWWLRLGIRTGRIKLGHPEQHGCYKRMHLTLKQEATRAAADNVLQQQARFETILDHDCRERPHQSDARQGLDPLQVRDLGTSSPQACTQPPFSRVPFYFVGSAALDALVAWVRDGIEPAAGPDIVTPSVAPTSAEIARDSFGNALGGIRLSQHEVPTAANTGVNSGSGFCSLYGSYQAFDDKTLAALYRSHDTYVSRVTQVTQDNVRRGFIVREDAEATIREAARSAIGKR